MPQGLQHSCHAHATISDCGTHKNFSRKSKVKADFKLKSKDNGNFKLKSKSQGIILASTAVAGSSMEDCEVTPPCI